MFIVNKVLKLNRLSIINFKKEYDIVFKIWKEVLYTS